MAKLNTYAITISYDDPSFNTMIISAENQQAAEEIVEKMTAKMSNVDIIQVHDIKDAKALKQFIDSQQTQGQFN